MHSVYHTRVNYVLRPRALCQRAARRWEGRPRTPPFKWGEEGEILPPHDTWLTEMDLKAEGLSALVEPEMVKVDASLMDKDLQKTKELLIEYAGAMQVGAGAGRAQRATRRLALPKQGCMRQQQTSRACLPCSLGAWRARAGPHARAARARLRRWCSTTRVRRARAAGTSWARSRCRSSVA